MIIAVDIGTRQLGWSLFTNGEYYRSGVLKSSKINWVENIERIYYKLKIVIEKYNIDTFIFEKPEFWMYGKGITGATSGSIVKLSVSLGAFLSIVFNQANKKIILIEAKKWKGQLPKRVTMKRINKIIKKDIKNDNESDAIGIGLFHLGRF